jgi:hypothetical protein
MKKAVFGSRFLKGATVEGKSTLRQIISIGYKLYVSFWYFFAKRCTVYPFIVSDMQAPFKLFPKTKIDLTKLTVDRFAGDVELALNLQVDVVNHPVQFVHKRGSKLPFSAIFSMALETMQVALRYRKLNKGNSRRNRDKEL